MNKNTTEIKDTSAMPAVTAIVDDKMVADLDDLLRNQTGKEGMVDILTGLYMDYSKLIIRHIQCQGEVEIPADFDNQLSFLREIINVFSGKYTNTLNNKF